jgi:hypothetical protein
VRAVGVTMILWRRQTEMQCPHCGRATTVEHLQTRLGGPLDIDICLSCQALWFDRYESLQLSPAAILRLFAIIGDAMAGARPAPWQGGRCPRCDAALVLIHDMQRTTRFQYWRCPLEHGRLITFFDFLREKDFIHPLAPAQLAELRQNFESINCSNCGAPVDVDQGKCGHCGTPVSMLDLHQAERLIADLQHAAGPRAPEENKPTGDAAGPPSHDWNWLKGTRSPDLVAGGLQRLLQQIQQF